MHSLKGWDWVTLGSLVGSVWGAAMHGPIITPAPDIGSEVWIKRQEPDAASFAQVLLTAIPLSLRQIAATNAPAVSSILWEQFLDDKKPQWFLNLPWDIQSYLIKEFGPETAWLTTPPQTTGAHATPTESQWQWPTPSSKQNPSSKTPSTSISVSSSAGGLSTSAPPRPSATVPSASRSLHTVSTGGSSKKSTSSATTSSSITTDSALNPSATGDPIAPSANATGFTRRQKIGLGVGIPAGILGAALLLLGCCLLLRRRKRKQIDGSEPPSSPGFIPRFAFQDKSTDRLEHRAPLNPKSNQADQDFGAINWEDIGYDPYESASFASNPMAPLERANTSPPTAAPAPVPMMVHDPQPIMAPALYHTHSSNRARGRRTSYSSLHSVTELSEPDDDAESPVLGRQNTEFQRKKRPSLPMVLEIPSVPHAATIKRKPVSGSTIAMENNKAADLASQSLLRPEMTHLDHSGSSSSGLALSINSSTGVGYQTDTTSPISPLSPHAPMNPFSNDYSYVEDYGPEYQNGYIDHDDGLYGGNRSLDRYPAPSPPRRSSKTEWPLRNISLGHRRNRSPMWDRLYER